MSEIDLSVYSDFVKPLKMTKIETSENFSTFVLHPIEKGFGVTIGNSLRRILLSSIRGVCVDWISFKGISHEYSSIDGVIEDVMNIALNIKNIVIKADKVNNGILTLNIKKSGVVNASSISCPQGVEIVNPDCYLFTVSSSSIDISIDISIQSGFGVKIVNHDNIKDYKTGRIYLNKFYTPVKNVSFMIDSVTYNGKTDYEKLTIEVTTNGSTSPANCIGIASSLMRDVLIPFVNFDESSLSLEIDFNNKLQKKDITSISNKIDKEVVDKPIEYVEFSVRTSNCLKKMSISNLSELAKKSPMRLLSMKNFGKKSLNEVIQKLSENGFKLAED